MANDRSFQLLRTNPALTGNIKVVVDSNYKIYLESYNTNKELSKTRFKHFIINKEQEYSTAVNYFFNDFPENFIYDVKDDEDSDIMYDEYIYQFDPIYYAGAANIEDKWYKEEFEYHAPLYIKPNQLPEGFVILRVDDPAVFDKNSGYVLDGLNKDNFRNQVIDKWKAVSLFDLGIESDLGEWMDLNFIDNKNYPTKSFEFNIKPDSFTRWHGLNIKTGMWCNKTKYLEKDLEFDQPHFNLETKVVDGYRDNGLLYPHIINFKYLFDDTPANPFEIKKYSLNRYYGFYVDKLDLITNLTTYDPPKLNSDVTIFNNIFVDKVDLKTPKYPFEESWDPDNRSYYIYANNDLYEVKRNMEDDEWVYKILSDKEIKLEDVNTNGIIDIIYSNTGRTKYENIIEGRYNNLEIDTYINKNDEKEGLYGDLYLIEIDGKFHVLKYSSNLESIESNTGSTLFYYTGSTNDMVSYEDNIFIATNSGISLYNWNGNLIWEADIDNSDLPSNKVNSLYYKDDFLYAGTDNGIWIKNFNNQKKFGNLIINTSNSNLPCNEITKIYYNNYIAASCYDSGTTNYKWWTNYNDGEVNRLSGRTGTLTDETIKAFSIEDDLLYVLEGNNIRKYYNFIETDYLEYNTNNTSIPDTEINDLYVEDEVIYIGTGKGFFLKNNQFEKIWGESFDVNGS
ncbi:MAG: hypothetical protein ACOCRK_09060, partial [bacterium]